MAKDRIDLQIELEKIPGIREVYYDPPESIRMQYDCIVYYLSGIQAHYADDSRYVNKRCYNVTLISRSADNAAIDELLQRFQYINFDRSYTADNLHHWVFKLYF